MEINELWTRKRLSKSERTWANKLNWNTSVLVRVFQSNWLTGLSRYEGCRSGIEVSIILIILISIRRVKCLGISQFCQSQVKNKDTLVCSGKNLSVDWVVFDVYEYYATTKTEQLQAIFSDCLIVGTSSSWCTTQLRNTRAAMQLEIYFDTTPHPLQVLRGYEYYAAKRAAQLRVIRIKCLVIVTTYSWCTTLLRHTRAAMQLGTISFNHSIYYVTTSTKRLRGLHINEQQALMLDY